MTQISIDRRHFGEAASSGVAVAASGLFAKIRKPEVLLVVAICAVGLALTLIAAFSMPDFSDAIAEVQFVGP